ncbi:MAG: hypothetical protein ACFFCQ_16020 [Promethearchaeota archaeon]
MSKTEDILSPPQRELEPYPAKYITLVTGDKMVVRQAERDELPLLLDVIYPLIRVDFDYYDLVGVRTYAEILAILHDRTVEQFVLLGIVNGELVGLVNSRQYSPTIGMSLHTMAFKRGLRVGAHLFAAKMEHHFRLGSKEVLIVAESPIGFKRWMEELRLEEKADIPHEHGGVPSWVLTRKNFEEYVLPERVFGERPVPEDLLKSSFPLRPPKDVVDQITRGKMTLDDIKIPRW